MKRTPPLVLAILAFLIFLPLVNAANPVINNVMAFPDPVVTGENVTIRANVTDSDGDIDKVLVNFTYPVDEILEMTNVSGVYEVNYTPSFATLHLYEIFANDSTGNFTVSDIYNFTARTEAEAVISVEVSPLCGVGFSFYYVPDEVVRNQTVFFIQINENIGNMDVNETSEMYLDYENGTLEWGPHDDDMVELEPWEEDLYYGLWTTHEDTALGTYYWHGITNFIGLLSRGGENDTTQYAWPEYNNTANCTEPDGNNETTCWYHFKKTCFNAYANEHQFNTTGTSSVTVPGQNTSSPTYHDSANISSEIYNAYTFYMNDCTEYCYACISKDTNVTEDECAYSTEWLNGIIENDLGNLTVTSLSSNGMNVIFSETFTSCTDRYIVSYCTVNYTAGLLTCTEKIQCNGSLEIVDDLEVVIQLGGVEEQPSPEPYPEPSPSPSPKPTPEPGPIEINIYPVEPEVSGMQEQLTPVEFIIENLGGKTVTDITLVPIVGDDWIAENASVDTIAPREKLNRTLFIQPTYKVEPSIYAIPVQALSSDGDILDMTYFWFEVLPGKFLAKIKIVESPSEITLDSDSLEYIPILVKNIGKKPLTGIKAKLENIEECLLNVTSPEIELNLDEESGLDLKVKTTTGPKTCNAMLIVESDQKAYAFAKIKINVAPPSALLPFGLPLIPLLVVIFLILLVLLIILRRRGRYVGILYPIVSASTLILLAYIFLWYLGFVPLF